MDVSYYLDGKLKSNLDILIDAVTKKWDAVLIVDGIEGAGKSTFAAQIANYLTKKTNPNNNFNLNNVVFTPEQFEHAVLTNRETAIVWDESVFGALASEWSTIVNKTITKLFITIRSRQLYVIILIPFIYMLQPYLAIGRTRALFHIWTPDGIKRGYFKFYNFDKKRELYIRNKKYYTYSHIKPDFQGKFQETDNLFFSQHEYDQKKDEAVKKLTFNINEERKEVKKIYEKYKKSLTLGIFQLTQIEPRVSINALARIFGLKPNEITKFLFEARELNEYKNKDDILYYKVINFF